MPSAQNRRERPAKPALTREGIIDTAVEIMEREGLRRVTMRRLATALDTGPASLYVLAEGGAPETRAAWGVDILLQSATAAAAEHSARAENGRSDEEWQQLVQA
uniref:TetR family transcriptional regulator n=1 Tax=Streptomyces flavofungini TaxID=68200 RepID=UPI0034DEF9D9